MAEMKNSESNKQKPLLSSYQSKNCQAPKVSKGTILQRQQKLQQQHKRYQAQNKQKRLLKKVNFNIDLLELHNNVDNYTFQGGDWRKHFASWTNIASDTFIFNFVQQVLKLNFAGEIPTNVPFEYKRSQFKQIIIDEEVRKLIQRKVIVTTKVQEGDFF